MQFCFCNSLRYKSILKRAKIEKYVTVTCHSCQSFQFMARDRRGVDNVDISRCRKSAVLQLMTLLLTNLVIITKILIQSPI